MEAIKKMSSIGGPGPYLESRYGNAEQKLAFAKALWDLLPPDNTQTYHLTDSLTHASVDAAAPSTIVHVAALGIDKCSSSYGFPMATTCEQIAEEILTDGFLTSGEPLLVMKKATEDLNGDVAAPWSGCGGVGPLQPFSLSFVKGRARAATAFAILSLVVDEDIDLKLVYPKLWESLRCVHVKPIRVVNDREQALLNIKLSQRGSIRKGYNCITWVMTLRSLQQKGDSDAAVLVRQYNANSSKQFQLGGAKAMSVKCVFELMPMDVWNLLTKIVSQVGWQACPFTDDGLGLRRIYPGATTRCTSKPWAERLRVSAESMLLMFRSIQGCLGMDGLRKRSKLGKQEMEELAEQAAYVYNMGKEAMKLAPLTEDIIKAEWLDKFVEDDATVMMEVQTFLNSKTADHSPRDVQTLNALMDGQAAKAPVQPIGASISLQSLEEDAFAHLLRQLDYDIAAIRVHKEKTGTYSNAVYHKKLEWRVTAEKASKRAAEHYMDRFVCIASCMDDSQLKEENRAFKRKIMDSMQIGSDDVICILLLNWVNPASVKAATMHKQVAEAQEVLAESDRNVGLCLMPEFVYTKGTLWMQEVQCAKLLSKQRINVDRTAHMQCHDRLMG